MDCFASLAMTEKSESEEPMSSDLDQLTALNRDYVASVQNCDVKRFNEILAPEFYCSNPDKTLVDRAAFLKQTAVPITIKNLIEQDVKIRILGDFAIIHAGTSYTTADGTQAHGRYTDCWAKQNGKWLAVSAHVSR
jgi:ketosteroid isomerase-like protein